MPRSSSSPPPRKRMPSTIVHPPNRTPIRLPVPLSWPSSSSNSSINPLPVLPAPAPAPASAPAPAPPPAPRSYSPSPIHSLVTNKRKSSQTQTASSIRSYFLPVTPSTRHVLSASNNGSVSSIPSNAQPPSSRDSLPDDIPSSPLAFMATIQSSRIPPTLVRAQPQSIAIQETTSFQNTIGIEDRAQREPLEFLGSRPNLEDIYSDPIQVPDDDYQEFTELPNPANLAEAHESSDQDEDMSDSTAPISVHDDESEIDNIHGEEDDIDSDLELDQVADEILKIFHLKDLGCGSVKHEEAVKQHQLEQEGDNCYDLSTTYSPDISFLRGGISNTMIVGLHNRRFPKPLDVARGSFMTGTTIRTLMEGCSTDESLPRNVCLHEEYRPVSQPRVEYDTDSILLYVDDLSSFKKNIHTVFSKITTHNVQTDLHYQTQVHRRLADGTIIQAQTDIRDLPQLYIGTAPEFGNSALFRVFPLLEREKGKTWLTDRDAERYFTHVWIKSCRQKCSDGTRQYLPPTFQVAEQKASAQVKEHASGGESKARTIKNYPIPASELLQIEQYAQRIIQDPDNGLRDFRYSFIFMDVKNTKLNLRDQHLWQTLERFDSLVDSNLHEEDTTLLSDLALEIIPSSPPSTNTDGYPGNRIDADAQVYLWKACCLHGIISELQSNIFSGNPGKVQTFHNVFLQDSTCVTVTPPVKSTARRAGLLYIQAYVVEKAFEDANAIRPFDRTEIVNLAIDNELYRSQSFSLRRKTLEDNYLSSKHREALTLDAYQGSSSGVRFEIRILRPLRTRLRERAWKELHPLGENPEFLWILPTTTWLDFKRGNFDKITSLIDVIILFNPATGVTNGSAQLLFVLLHYLQNLSNCNPRRKSLLWTARRTVDNITEYGLGLRETMTKHGFGWVLPIIDWERFCLKPEIEGNIAGVRDVVGVCYNDQEAIRLVSDNKSLMDVCYDALRKSRPGSTGEYAALRAMAGFVVRTYRRDVWDILCPERKGEVREEFQGKKARDSTQFCWEGLREALVKPPLLITGNRAGATFGPDEVFRWVMTKEVMDRKRTHMDGDGGRRSRKPYRTSLYQIWQITSSKPGLTVRWNNVLRDECKSYLWLFPMPDGNGGLTCCERKRHKFVSIMVDEKRNWYWAKGETRSGRPPPWPKTLSMSPQDLAVYLSKA